MKQIAERAAYTFIDWSIFFFSIHWYALEFIFVGIPFFFAQGTMILFAIGGFEVWQDPTFLEGTLSVNLSSENLDISFLYFILPLGFSFLIEIISTVLPGKKQTWAMRSIVLSIINTICFLLLFIPLQIAIQGNPDANALWVILLVLPFTIAITFLHFYLKEKIYHRGLQNMYAFGKKYGNANELNKKKNITRG